jgi:SHS family sialic acid transporter-like MFS transporter
MRSRMNVTSSPSTEQLKASQWIVLLAAGLGWLFDGYEIGLFPLLARPALKQILGGAGDGQIGQWMGIITAFFLVGAAFGGVLFGYLGDRIGRVRSMALSILVYSLVTGFGYFAQTPMHLAIIRGVSALGMGGQWALGVALVMESWPERWRPILAGAMGAAANVGFLLVGVTGKLHPVTPESWRWMMIVAALPALIAVFVVALVPESEKWKASAGSASKEGSAFAEIFGARYRSRTLLGITFASVSLIGTWGAVQWLPLWADQLVEGTNPTAKADTQMVQAFGAIVGALIAPLLGARMGRRASYFLLCLLSLVVCEAMFKVLTNFGPQFLIAAFVSSAVTASFYGWFPLYFPELFPTRIRATAQGLCYNSGRIFAAVGAVTQGELVRALGGSYAKAGSIVVLIYVLGLGLIWLAPETKGQALPE